jgi:hypothetical protein
MDGRTPARVVFHASLVFLVALACGVPYAASITNGAGEDVVRGWRVAHLGLVAGAIWGIAVGASLRDVVLGDGAVRLLVGSLLLALWGFVLALVLGALAGVRGLVPGESVANTVAFLANLVASVASVASMILLAAGARAAARAS